MSDVERGWRESPAGPRSTSAIVVNLRIPAAASCVVLPTSVNGLVCTAHPAASVDEARAFVAQQIDANQAVQGFVYADYEQLIVQTVDHRLRERFGSVTVLVNEPNPPSGAIDVHVDFALTALAGPIERATATLRAGQAGGAQLDASGAGARRATFGWLAWSVPVALVTFPIGLIAIPAGARAMRRRISAESIAEALDASARQLAELLAQQGAATLAGPLPPAAALAD
jgi:hypothetical protein